MDTIKKLISGSDIEFIDSLLDFTEKYETHLTFDELNRDNLRNDVWDSIFKRLQQAKYFTIHERCLHVLRILSRDKTGLDDLINDERLNLIIKNASLDKKESVKSSATFTNVTQESLKLLCNLLFNSSTVQQKIGETSCLPCIVERMKNYDETVPHNIKLFDTRILFLSTALNSSLRKVVKNELNGDLCLMEMLKKLANDFESTQCPIKNDEVVVASEILKVLFNLYINVEESRNEEMERYQNLAEICYKLLVNKGAHKIANEIELHSNIINILTVIPYNCYNPLIQPIGDADGGIIYEKMNMTAIDRLLKFLDEKLNGSSDLVPNLSPVTTALIRLVKSNRLIRKYVRSQILPPLKDVMKRPEEGSTLRAKLCKLLTCPITELSDLVAELIFVLCKENVSRMVKYTGYGNAAGMFANKGLLGRGQSANSSAYSSESEDSDTEEYTKYKENINPVTGCYEHPKPNPLEGMSDEQKEYEAMKLVGLVDQLTKQGVVQPCRIGEDGKPKPIEHILELQEELPKLNMNNQTND
ncbi:synembryn [Venturia canescens]|uniref:synembryn n=1 Tax=Venturia canescens TaxID=32260 RepID=UPI001C9CB8ED|nr:synembryn [Venturia canescens]XP_043269505.1 synembryn [Venturia canescens]